MSNTETNKILLDNLCLSQFSARQNFDKLFDPNNAAKSALKLCDCEALNEIDRIKCLVNEYAVLLDRRGQPMTIKRYNTLMKTSEARHIELLNIEVGSVTEELAETQIFYTFLRHYMKRHPNFSEWGPALTDIKLKSDFYSST